MAEAARAGKVAPGPGGLLCLLTMAPLSRREFIGGTLATTALVLGRHRAGAATVPDLVDVSGTDPAAMVGAALGPLGGIGAFVSKGARVVIKPNWSFANPVDWGTGTHPMTVIGMAVLCIGAGAAEVTVVEYPLSETNRALERTGAKAALANAPGVKLKILGDDKDFREVDIPGGSVLKKTRVATIALEADVLINLPNAKSHGGAVVSFGLKNAMGLVSDRRGMHKAGLAEAIADVARVIRPHLTVVDATRVLVTGGPAGPGDTVKVGRMVAGRNVVSVDAYCLGLTRFGKRDLKVADVRHIDLAGKAGLGETDVSKLRVDQVTV
jgi:uncharacterized protein (DUF362 family)